MSTREPNIAAIVPSVGADHITEERPIPSPKAGEVLVRNHAIALNPVDWKRQARNSYIASYPVVLGSDISGIIIEVGPNVLDLKAGDRVLACGDAMVNGNNDRAGFQTYTIVSAHGVTKIPDALNFASAATHPMAVATAGIALFDILGLPRPVGPDYLQPSLWESPNALLVWGGASSVGYATIQMARIAGLTVFTTASERHHDKMRALGASVVIDYRSPTVVEDLEEAARREGKSLSYVVDAISNEETIGLIMKLLAKGAGTRKLAYSTSLPKGMPLNKDIAAQFIPGQDLAIRRRDLCAWLFNKALPVWLEKRAIEDLKHRVVEGGLNGIQDGLRQLKEGVSGEKLVIEV